MQIIQKEGALEPGRICVLSYNIRHGEGMDGRIDLRRIAKTINSVSPDIVSLQEVDDRRERTGGVDQVAELADLTGLRAVFGPAIIRKSGGYGNAVLSRFPVLDTQNYPIPGAREPRSILAVSVDVSLAGLEGMTATFLATHFSLHEESRLRTARFVEAIVSDFPDPALLTGDLNARPESQTLGNLCKTWTSATEGKILITLLPKPVQIDYILFRPAARWRVINTWVVDDRISSDHCPLAADVLSAVEPVSSLLKVFASETSPLYTSF